jgi:hypothetical protein
MRENRLTEDPLLCSEKEKLLVAHTVPLVVKKEQGGPACPQSSTHGAKRSFTPPHSQS